MVVVIVVTAVVVAVVVVVTVEADTGATVEEGTTLEAVALVTGTCGDVVLVADELDDSLLGTDDVTLVTEEHCFAGDALLLTTEILLGEDVLLLADVETLFGGDAALLTCDADLLEGDDVLHEDVNLFEDVETAVSIFTSNDPLFTLLSPV